MATGSASVFGASFSMIAPNTPWYAAGAGGAGQPTGAGIIPEPSASGASGSPAWSDS
jgi:hypothetical protein